MDSFQDDPQYKGMKYLVFGTILSSLLSELQIIIPKIDRNGVCIRARTLTVRENRQKHKHKHIRVGDTHVTRQSILGGGHPCSLGAGIPVVEVRKGAKRPWMRIIPDSPENTPHQSKPLPHSAAHTSQPRRRLRGRRPRATRTPSRVQTPHAHAACCTLHRMRVAGILWKSLVVGRAVASARRALSDDH